MISKLILGTVQFGLNYGINNNSGKISPCEVNKILEKACSFGIKKIDTAAAYGDSEKLIGNFILNKSFSPFRIITKVSSNDLRSLDFAINERLRLLNINKIDTLLFHSFESLETAMSNRYFDALLKSKGDFFSKIGVSVYNNQELNQILNMDSITTVQAPFNILDNESQRGDIFKKLKERGKTIHVRSAFLQGLFFMKINSLPKNLNPLKPYLNQLTKIADSAKVSLGELALKYSLSKEYIDGVLIGVDSLEQLELNLTWSSNKLDDKVIESIDNISVEDINLLNPSLWNIEK